MRWTITNEQQLGVIISYLQSLKPNAEKVYDVCVSRKTKKRTIPQNSLLHAWLACIADETGNDAEDLKEYFGNRYLPKREVVIFGEVVERLVSTTTLDTKQFSDFTDRIQRDAAEQEIILVYPDSPMWDSFYDKYGKRVV